MSKSQLSILIQLAKVDGHISTEEYKLISEIGAANGMSDAEIKGTLDNPIIAQDLSGLSADSKFEYLINIVQLMKVDGRMFRDEIRYCSKMASRLGYEESVLFELITQIAKDKDLDKEHLREKVKKYLK